MVIKDYFSNIFEKNNSNTLLLHSSLLYKNKSVFKESIYEIKNAIEDLSREGFTFILPSYTFSFIKDKFFSTIYSKSETGILSDLIHQDLCGSIRSSHPIYSHVFIGPDSEKMSSLLGITTFGEESIFEFLEKINASIALLNCGWEYATIFHRYEELNKVSYRYYKKFNGKIKHYDEKLKNIEVKMFVRNLELNPINDMNLALDILKTKGSFCKFVSDNFNLTSASVLDIKSTCMYLLNKNNYALLKNETDIKHKLLNAKINSNNNEFKIYIIGFSNLDILKKELSKNLKQNINNRNFQISSNPYGQVFEILMNPNSDLYTKKPNLIIATVNSQDFDLEKDLDDLKIIFNRYINQVIEASLKIRCKVIFHRISPPELARFSNIEKKIFQAIDLYNSILMNKIIDQQNIQVIDQASLAANNSFQIFDERTYYLGKIVNTKNFRAALIEHWTSYIADLTGNSIRLIICDLDNTLWGGVLGEDGLSNIKINGDFPGNCFKSFQKELLSLKKQGIILAISSKNNFSDVEELFKTIKMPLGKEDFAVIKADWKEKHLNIIEIASELNLGFSSILFIDDNPSEREAIKNFLPEVKVINLPKDPAYYVSALRRYPFLSSFLSGNSNSEKKGVQNLATLNALKKSGNSNSLINYLRNLKINIYFQNLKEDNLQRAEQLCQKTNQFNSTSIRYSSRELLEISENDNSSLTVIGHSSNDQEFENIGLLVFNSNLKNDTLSINLYLLSCRVLGRGIENICLFWIAKRLREKGYKYLNVSYLKTDRNLPFEMLINKNKGILNLSGEWEFDLNKHFDSRLLEKSHIKINDSFSSNLF